jgi:hypothetical protein
MTLTQLITSLRALAGDSLDSKVIFSENLGGSDYLSFPVDGVNTVFRLKSVPLSDVAGTPVYTWLTIIGTGAVSRTHAGFTITDQKNGIITFTVAPNPGNATPNAGVYLDYNYIWFTDDKYTEFLNQAAQDTMAGTATDPTTIVDGLTQAMLQYALSYFWMARASLYAEQYESTGGDASERVQTVTQAYMALAKNAKAQGDDKRKMFYQRQGQRDLPSSQDGNVNFDPISPIR